MPRHNNPPPQVPQQNVVLLSVRLSVIIHYAAPTTIVNASQCDLYRDFVQFTDLHLCLVFVFVYLFLLNLLL